MRQMYITLRGAMEGVVLHELFIKDIRAVGRRDIEEELCPEFAGRAFGHAIIMLGKRRNPTYQIEVTLNSRAIDRSLHDIGTDLAIRRLTKYEAHIVSEVLWAIKLLVTGVSDCITRKRPLTTCQ